MTRFALVVLGLSLWFGIGLSAQQPGQSSLRTSLEREATRLASTVAADDPSSNGSTGVNGRAARIQRLDDWDTVRRLKNGTRVLVTIAQDRRIKGTFEQADESALIVRTGRWQEVQTIARGDVQEVRTGPSDKRRALGLLGGLGGFFGGAVVGAYLGDRLGGCEASNLGCVTLGGMAGMVGGAVLGYRAVTSKRDLVYSAPLGGG